MNLFAKFICLFRTGGVTILGLENSFKQRKRRKMQSIFQVLVFFSFLVSVFAAINGDLISNLPGLSSNDTGFAMYSGYITVASSRHYHYWFVESSSTSASVPVILWLNGGPGMNRVIVIVLRMFIIVGIIGGERSIQS